MLLAVAAPVLAPVWAPVVGTVAVATMTVGNVMALRERVAVRLLAWSAVAQAGWVILPLAGIRFWTTGYVLAPARDPGSRAAVAASVGYLAAYAAAGLTAFAVVVVFSRHVASPEEHTVAAYRGLARREPVAAAVLALALVSLAGLPPGVAGLVAKVLALRPVVDAGAWAVAVAAAVNVAIGLAYYLRWTANLVAAPVDGQPVPTWRLRPAEGLGLGLAAGAVVALSVFAQALAVLVPGAVG
jgi:NADH-quinone oxidoreductase subunit N